MLKVVHLTSAHPPDDVRIFSKECRSLALAGFDTTLVVPWDRTVHDDAVHIVPVPKPKGRVERFTLTLGRIYWTALKLDADLYHFHDPDLMPVGFLLKLGGKRVIYDAHEDVPADILLKEWLPAIVRSAVASGARAMEWLAARFLDQIVTVVPAIAARFPKHKVTMVRNYPILGELKMTNARDFVQRERAVVYAGELAKIRGLKTMLDAAVDIAEHATVRLYFAGQFGDGTDQIYAENHPGWKLTEYCGYLDRDSLAKLYARARCGLAVLNDVPTYRDSLAIKLLEYLSVGLPVVASDFPLWREIIDKGKCGILVEPENTGQTVKAVEWLLDHPAEAEEMGRRGRDLVEKEYSWEAERSALIALYRKLLS